MTATVAKIARFTASREQACTSCSGVVAVGSRGGYAPGAKVLCEDCCGGSDGGGPVQMPVKQPELSVSPAIVVAPTLCGCTDRKDGFTNTEFGWVHAGCGLPAVVSSTELEQAENEAWVRGDTSALDNPPHPTVAATETPEETRDATPTPAAEPVGAPEPAPAAEPTPPKRKRRTRRQPDAGEQAGPVGGGVRAGEAAGGRESGTAEGDHGRDQGGAGQATATGGDVDPADQPAPADPVADEVQGGGLVDRLEGDQGRGAGGSVEAVGEAGPVVVGTAGGGLTPMSGIMGAFYAQAAPVSAAVTRVNGNTPLAEQYAREMREFAVAHANNDPRSLQKHLGPSEIGHSCSRMIVAKLAGLPVINHTTDPWASIMGRAGHKWTEELRLWINEQLGQPRFLAEHRVTPGGSGDAFVEHSGSADGYDLAYKAVVDDKFLSDWSMGRLKQHGPPRHYWTQFLLYRRGLLALGLPVDRIILLAWPRTKSTLDAMYVWEETVTPEHEQFLDGVIAPELLWRKQWAAAVQAGTAQLMDVPADTEDTCQWCPVYRPASARDGLYGCPGHTAGN